MNVASRLAESSLNEAAIRNSELNVVKKNVISKDEFFLELEKIATSCPPALPFLHVDLHGNKDFFQLSNGDQISWPELGDKLRQINIACGLNLVVAVSACYGGYASIATQLMSPAPFFSLCGPLQEVSAGILLNDYERFYQKLFETRNFDRSLDAMNQESPTRYEGISARYLFNLGWSHYIRTLCAGKALKERIENVVRMAIANGIPKSDLSRVRKHARQTISNPRVHFEQARDIFFLYNSHPENKHRFLFSYDDLDDFD